MTEFVLQDLKRLLKSCAGVDEAVDLDGPVADTSFGDLGYDSLALFELLGRVRREYGVDLPDDALTETSTPKVAVDVIGGRIARSGG
ncbi:act minimal PKS acyl carrier protein [Saccharothrix tamanrassetensis]|uniref:Act minimal PKS acyl carrier protein n=1 Tax=Saccharothrix tamanrassetensis TaxID=1051531 RepID=A0A841CK43_9PSEU|nr:acyl carrier protein [Saccharothrix tamanrassetensis]MBB5957440.1 act minimal PKS acyl carrier protein [Saccharothrix tamanrassetensis]